MTIRVLVFDDHPVVHYGLTELLNRSGFQVVGHAYDASEALEKVLQTQPNVILMDVQLPDNDGLKVLEELGTNHSDVVRIMYSAHDNPTYVARAIALGAADYVLKGDPPEHLVESITNATQGIAPASGSLFHRVQAIMKLRNELENGNHSLTRREVQVLRHISLGLSNREIGRSLGISVETVKEHVQNILRKLNSNDRTQAAVWAAKRGLVDV